MTSVTRRTALLAISALASACASNQFAGTKATSSGIDIRNTRLQVYSFLDLRDAEFGPNMLAEFDKQFAAALAASSVTVSTLRFKNSQPGRYFATTSGGVSVPVRDTIESNASEERAFGASYRLIIFPSKMTLSGAWKFYDVRWDLVDTRTGRIVWTTTSQGKHINAWKNDEDPAARAKTIVDGIVGELKSSKLI